MVRTESRFTNCAAGSPIKERTPNVPREIKIATFNVEWMVSLFAKGKPRLLARPTKEKIGLGGRVKDPQGVGNRIASVIRDLKADIIGICEGPPLKEQMETFVREKLGDAYSVYSMPGNLQSVHALVSKRLRGLTVTQLPENDPAYQRLRAKRSFYQAGEFVKPMSMSFIRKPVVLRLGRKGRITELMILHTKSKYSKLKKPSEWEKKDREKIIDALRARQKLSLEMNFVRKYIAYRLQSQTADAVIVMGDFNDGVTRDIVEDSYLFHSIIHELRGPFHHGDVTLMRHVLHWRKLQRKSTWTVEFRDPARGGTKTKVLLDHIIYSPRCHEGGNIRFVPGSGCIEEKIYKKYVSGKGRTRDERPSDHVPLSGNFALV